VISPIHIVDQGAFRDIGAAVLITLTLVPFVLKGSMTRLEGGVLASGYCLYMLAPLVFG